MLFNFSIILFAVISDHRFLLADIKYDAAENDDDNEDCLQSELIGEGFYLKHTGMGAF